MVHSRGWKGLKQVREDVGSFVLFCFVLFLSQGLAK
jgi:hypothetical protein